MTDSHQQKDVIDKTDDIDKNYQKKYNALFSNFSSRIRRLEGKNDTLDGENDTLEGKVVLNTLNSRNYRSR